MWALSSLCVASSCRELAAMHSGVEAISASLKEYRPLGSSDAERQSSAKAQTAALSALEALCRDCIGNQNTAAECSCLEAAVAALHDLEDSTEVVEAGCKAICSIVHKRPELQMRACTAGAMAALVRVLDRYFHDPDIVEIATHCIHAVADKSADCQMQATVDNAIPVFVKAMKKQQGSVEVLECCLRAVSCIAWTHVRAKARSSSLIPLVLSCSLQLAVRVRIFASLVVGLSPYINAHTHHLWYGLSTLSFSLHPAGASGGRGRPRVRRGRGECLPREPGRLPRRVWAAERRDERPRARAGAGACEARRRGTDVPQGAGAPQPRQQDQPAREPRPGGENAPPTASES